MPKYAAKPQRTSASPSSKAVRLTPTPLQLEPIAEAEARTDNFWAWTPFAYAIDTLQRQVLFWDAIRKRADICLEHESQGLPPVLNFEYEMVLDARHFDRPCNYALLAISRFGDACMEHCFDPEKPPVIIVDPRAGHGPGIGGSKRESEVGVAMHQGHAVYFVAFYPKPEPHQSIPDVLEALSRFVTEVRRRHDDRPPILIGNCQAGWMLTLLSAVHKELSGPVVLCGSPLSYWAGKPGKNAMQLEGGLVGGSWLSHFLGDLGAGEFDGAWLVFNFENLNPTHAIWSKYYDLYAKIDTEEERFLSFERWWNGFYRFSTEEIVAVVSHLFVGNEIENGTFLLGDGCSVDLKNIGIPMVIFASEGDNITPPSQALAWVAAVYKTTEGLKAAGQRIVYMIHPHVGHLGIFVSAEVARKEHNAILNSVEQLSRLKPGFYEMKVSEGTFNENCELPTHKVRFEERAIEDIACGHSHAHFEKVKALSQWNEAIYRQWFSPWVQMMANPVAATAMRQMHPMRLTRYMWSQWANPAMWSVAALAPLVHATRMATFPDHPLRIMEARTSELVAQGLQQAKSSVDDTAREVFRLLYG